MQPLQQLEHSPSILLVQISGRFIRQQHFWPGDERPGNRNALLFPSRKFSCAMLGSVRQTNLRKPPARIPARFFLWLSTH